MPAFKSIALAGLLGVASISGAYAADAVTYPQPTPAVTEVSYDTDQFDWTGFYAGIYGVGELGHGATAGGTHGLGIGAMVGANMQMDYFVLGAEGAVQTLFNTGAHDAYGMVLGRGGVVVTDNLLAYAAAGVGTNLGGSAPDNSHVLLGGGLEYAVADSVSVRGQYLHGVPLNATSTSSHQVSFGAAFHF